MKYLRTVLVTFVCLSTLAFNAQAQNIQYSFQQDVDNPLRIQAMAIPSFSSKNVTISTGLFSFSLPASTQVLPEIEEVPKKGTFNNHTGIWTVQKLTPEAYEKVGFNGKDLTGQDIYLVVLRDAPELNNVIAGQGIPLFSFELANDCNEGQIDVLTNNGQKQQLLLRNLSLNFNNQMSMSIEDTPSRDLYLGKDPYSASFACPLALVSNTLEQDFIPGIKLQPNPTAYALQVMLQVAEKGPGEIIIFDIKQSQVYYQKETFSFGANEFRLEVDHLAPGNYLLVAKQGDIIFQEKFIKVRK